MDIQIGRVASKTGKVYAMETHTWPALCEVLTRHTVQPGKDGPGWVPGPIQPGPRTAARVPDWCVLALDIEAPAEAIPDTEPAPPRVHKRLTGPDVAPALEDVAVDLELLGWAGVGYTSYRHQEPALSVDGDVATLGPRYRLVLPVSRPVKKNEIRPLGLHVLGVLGLAHVADVACLEPARLFYFPSCPPERENLAQARIVDGEPLDVNRLLQEASAAAAPVRKAQGNTPSASVIDAFNNGADAGELLERYGYKRKGRNRWIWPGSTTGMAGVYLVPGTQRVVSRHSNDPLHADGKSNDAFGVWCELEHGGDYRAAVRAASKMLGMERKPTPAPTLPGPMAPAPAPAVEVIDPETGEILQRDAPTFPPLEDAQKQAPQTAHPLAQFHKIERKVKAVKWVVPGLIQEGIITIAGARGVGKTTAILPLALSVAGLHAPDYPFAPHPDRWRHVVYVVEQVEQAEHILAGIVEHSGWGVTWEQVEERVRIVESRRLAPAQVVGVGNLYREQFARVVDGVELLPLVVFDTQASIFEMESESDNSEASRIMALLKQDFAKLPAWIVGHVAKSNIGSNDVSSLTSRGAGSFEGDAIANCYLTSEGEGEARRGFFHVGKNRAEPRYGKELAIKSARVLVQGENAWGEMEDVALRWAWIEPLESGQTRQERREAEKLAGHVKTLQSAWWASGAEVRTGTPYLSRTALREYLVGTLGYATSTADKALKPSVAGQVVHDLLQADVIKPLDGGWVVVEPVTSSAWLLGKNDS